MKYIILLTGLTLALFSCKKDQPATNPSTGSSYSIPTTTGSYWIYHWTKIDSLGNETPYPNYTDTITIVGDSLLNGYHYIVYSGTTMGALKMTWLERDSSGYIVGQDGSISYTYLNTTAPFKTSSDSFYDEVNEMGSATTATTAAGTFNVLDRQRILTRSAGSTLPNPTGVNACGDVSYTFHAYYASGVGKIRQTSSYYNWFIQSCAILRSDLVEYHIAP